MHWYIEENFNVATELDGGPWGLDDTLTLVAKLPYEKRNEIEQALGEPKPVTVSDDGLREHSPTLDRIMSKAEEEGSASMSIEDIMQIEADREAAEAAGLYAPTPSYEREEDQSHRLSEAQLATARRVVAEASELYDQIKGVLLGIYTELEEARKADQDVWDDDELIDEIYESDYEDAPLGDLFDDPSDYEDDDYEEGWDPDDKPFEERFEIYGLEIPADDAGRLFVKGRCDWDPEHGFELKL